MFLFSLAFLCGIFLVAHLEYLPDFYWVGILLSVSGILLYCFKNRAWMIIVMMSGIVWAMLCAHHALSWDLSSTIENKPVTITGTIASIPVSIPHRTSFLVSLNTLESKPASGLVSLSYLGDDHLEVGDEWKFKARLKKIHGLMNPGGIETDEIAFEKGIKASGLAMSGNQIARHFYSHPMDRVREKLIEKIKETKNTATLDWIVALATGERQHIDPSAWEVLRRTGTNHLMAIGGLHIGFAAGMAGLLASMIWRRLARLPLILPAQEVGAIAALVMAIVYGAMAGFSIPTQRADSMLALFLLMRLNRRMILPWSVWGMALWIVLLLNPFCVLSTSVWLSFASIALIIYAMSARLSPTGWWWKHGRVQWIMALGLLPFSIGLFQECSWVSFIANSIAIPVVGFIVLPFVLLGCFCFLFSSTVAHGFIFMAGTALGWVWNILIYLSHFSWGSWHVATPHAWMIISAVFGVFILLAPIGLSGRWLGLFFLLPLLFFKSPVPNKGEVWFTLLDVGQGLSAVVQTHRHVLVFDAGAKWNNQDRGKDVVIPFLYSIGVNSIDKLVVSHGDNDHIGGAFSLIQAIPTSLIETSVPERFKPIFAEYCFRGEKWTWDDVQFEFLYPTPDTLGLDNDSSCVLRITAGQHAILLTGDIERKAEEYLIHESAAKLSADILVAPHHGSKTSDLDAFIQAVNPRIVLFPVGYLNRYHLPNPHVVEKYRARGIALYDSVRDGAIQFFLKRGEKDMSKPFLYRREHAHFFFK